jgi:hypothetical protein
MKLGENIYGHTISAKFDNQPNRFSNIRVMAIYWYKKWQIIRWAYFVAFWHSCVSITMNSAR